MGEVKKRKKGEIGQRLRQVRGNTSLIAFASQIGGNKTSWSLYENEDRWPDLELLIRVRDMTGISLDWLADGDEHQAPPAPLDAEILTGIIRAIESETPNLDAASKAKLISAFYSQHQKLTAGSNKPSPAKKAG